MLIKSCRISRQRYLLLANLSWIHGHAFSLACAEKTCPQMSCASELWCINFREDLGLTELSEIWAGKKRKSRYDCVQMSCMLRSLVFKLNYYHVHSTPRCTYRPIVVLVLKVWEIHGSVRNEVKWWWKCTYNVMSTYIVNHNGPNESLLTMASVYKIMSCTVHWVHWLRALVVFC